MDELRVIEIKKSVFADNDKDADILCGELKSKGVFLLNLMSAPGSGKTTTLIQTINRLKDRLRVAVMEADIDSDVDARKMKEATGVESIQLHTGGMCHLDAEMTRQGLDALMGYCDNAQSHNNTITQITQLAKDYFFTFFIDKNGENLKNSIFAESTGNGLSFLLSQNQ